MSHQSGICASEELLEALSEAKTGSLRLIHMQIEDEQIKLRKKCPATTRSWEDDYDELVLPFLNKIMGCYILYRLDSKKNIGYQWILLNWIPNEAHVWQKTLYAASRATLRRQFGDGYIEDDLMCHDVSDINLKGYKKHLESKTAPEPLSQSEFLMQEMKADNIVHCSYDDAHSSFGGIAFPLNEQAEAAVKKFQDGSLSYVQLQIDSENEKIKLAQTEEKLKPEDIASLTPVNSGSYHIYRFSHQYEGAQFDTVFFIYAIAGYQSEIKERMLYSSCKGVLIDLLIQKFKIEIEHKLEVDDFKELTTESFMETAHPKAAVAQNLVFSKPKGPGGRGPRRIIK